MTTATRQPTIFGWAHGWNSVQLNNKRGDFTIQQPTNTPVLSSPQPQHQQSLPSPVIVGKSLDGLTSISLRPGVTSDQLIKIHQSVDNGDDDEQQPIVIGHDCWVPQMQCLLLDDYTFMSPSLAEIDNGQQCTPLTLPLGEIGENVNYLESATAMLVDSVSQCRLILTTELVKPAKMVELKPSNNKQQQLQQEDRQLLDNNGDDVESDEGDYDDADSFLASSSDGENNDNEMDVTRDDDFLESNNPSEDDDNDGDSEYGEDSSEEEEEEDDDQDSYSEEYE